MVIAYKHENFVLTLINALCRSENYTNTQGLNNKLLNDHWVIEEIREEMLKLLEKKWEGKHNLTEPMQYSKGKLTTINAYILKNHRNLK
jgi:hypothetical protein